MSIFSCEICENCMQIIDRACFVADFFKMGNALQGHHHKVQIHIFYTSIALNRIFQSPENNCVLQNGGYPQMKLWEI